jgi:HlyD family secretion protein
MHRYLTNRKLLAVVLVVAVLLGVALWPRAAAVDVAAVSRGPLRVTVEHEGRTRAREPYVVSAPVAGRLLRIELEPGDTVRRDQTVATFLPADPGLLDARTRAQAQALVAAAEAVVGRAHAAVRAARATADRARSEAERQRALAAQRIASREALEAAETSARAADASLRAAEFDGRNAEQELAAARAQLVQQRRPGTAATLEIRSPISGVVLTRIQRSEAVLAAGTPLLQLGDPHDIEIVADFLSSDAVKISPGDPALIEQWGGERPLDARVRRVEPSGFLKVSALGVEEQRVNVLLDFADPAERWRRLGDGYRVEVRVVIWQHADVVKVPTSALFRSGERWAVLVADGGRARRRMVDLGQLAGLEAQVLSGVVPGDRVIVHPGDAVSDGARVKPRAAS